jgi:hypothetical protein
MDWPAHLVRILGGMDDDFEALQAYKERKRDR